MRQAVTLIAPLLVLQFTLLWASPIKSPSDPPACTDKIYVGGQSGDFSISEDGGQSWTITNPVTIPTSDHLIYAAYAVGDNVYVGSGSGISISKDGGKTWTEQDIGDGQSDPSVRTIYAIGNRVYAGVNVKRLRISNDSGDTWPIDVELDDSYKVINDMYVADTGRIFVATANGLGITDDDGQTWRYIDETADTGSNNVNAVAGNGDYVYVGMETERGDGVMSISADLGETWRTQDTAPTGKWKFSIYSISATDTNVYTAVYDAGVGISADNGESWAIKNKEQGLITNKVTKVSAVGDSLYVGTDRGVSISRDDGQSFTNVNVGVTHVTALFAQCV